MAEGKKSVLLYCDLIHTIEKMDNETAGEFFKHYLRYINDKEPKTDNLIVELTFESVKQNLKRDLLKWDEIKEKRSEAGKKSAEARALKKKEQTETNSTCVESVKQNLTNPTVTVNDNVNVTVNDINTNNNVPSDKPKESIDFVELLNYLNEQTKRIGNSKFRVINKTIKDKYKARLKDGYTKEDIIRAIDNACNNDFHKQKNYQYLTPEFFSRSNTLDKFCNTTEVKDINLNAKGMMTEDVKNLFQ